MRSGFIKMYNILRKSSWKFSQSFVIRSIALLSDIQSNRLKIKQTLIESYNFTDTQTNQLFSRNQMLQNLPAERVIKSIAMLHQLQLNSNEALSLYPFVIHQSAHTLKCRYETLKEVGFNEITINNVMNFAIIMSQTVDQCIKENTGFSPHPDIVKNIFRVADVPSNIIEAVPYNENDTLQKVHAAAVKVYARQRLQVVASKQFVDGRSLCSIESTVKMVEENIPGNFYKIPKSVFRFTPEEFKELLDLRLVDLRRMISRSNTHIQWHNQTEKLKYLDELMGQYGIADYAVANYPAIVLIDSQMLNRHFERISKLSNAHRLFKHPFIVQLVLRMGAFEEYTLANGQFFDDIFDETFAEYFLNAHASRNVQANNALYLSYRLNRTNDEIMSKMSKNPQGSRVKIHTIHDTLQYLLNEGYSTDDIFNCLNIAIYPLNDVKQALQQLKDANQTTTNANTEPITKTSWLQLCVLSIQRKYNFDYKNILNEYDSHSPETALELRQFIKKAVKLI